MATFSMKWLNNYFKPTPKKWRLFGDSLLLSCIGVVNYVSSDPVLLKIVVSGMIAGKFISNIFSEKK